MELDSIESVPSSDLTDEDEIHHHHIQFPSLPKPQSNSNNININNSNSVSSAIQSISVHELLECPVCTNSMYPPIHQCHNGHTLCSTCKTRVHNRCPTCRQELGDIRCLALEKVAESLELPCKYMSLGCPEIFPYYSKLKHEALCNFRPYNCPYAGSECAVVGDIPFLVAHLRDDHKVDMHSGCTFNHRYVKSNPREVENATWMLTVKACWVIDLMNSQPEFEPITNLSLDFLSGFILVVAWFGVRRLHVLGVRQVVKVFQEDEGKGRKKEEGGGVSKIRLMSMIPKHSNFKCL
ncbi:E3 ubiquitin-protein ligase SINAT3 isoform X2 [Hevea brasiliensis]|uniref:E3 ubiquitin-protein ligase SINAT3 isoform X2 n=1 Tax=Hevea brasiliensis TaxID=3981 RepID=UPI0025D4E629|nr:E3 ubiquitin-protein ligase SINAT3 isoform X2 [Hevea brasiliensis]